MNSPQKHMLFTQVKFLLLLLICTCLQCNSKGLSFGTMVPRTSTFKSWGPVCKQWGLHPWNGLMLDCSKASSCKVSSSQVGALQHSDTSDSIILRCSQRERLQRSNRWGSLISVSFWNFKLSKPLFFINFLVSKVLLWQWKNCLLYSLPLKDGDVLQFKVAVKCSSNSIPVQHYYS